jgi:hypothetical protein
MTCTSNWCAARSAAALRRAGEKGGTDFLELRTAELTDDQAGVALPHGLDRLPDPVERGRPLRVLTRGELVIVGQDLRDGAFNAAGRGWWVLGRFWGPCRPAAGSQEARNSGFHFSYRAAATVRSAPMWTRFFACHT